MIDSVSESAGGRSRRKRKPSLPVDRLPPHSPEAEQGVLGCCLLSPVECLSQITAKFHGHSVFYDLRHQTIYTALLCLFTNRLPIDIITLQQYLADNQLLDQVGGIPYLNTLQDAVPSAANVTYYADIVFEKYQLRRAMQLGAAIVDRGHEFQGDVSTLLDEVTRDLERLRPADKDDGETSTWSELLSFDTDHDANSVIGRRFLCRGHSAWLIGPSGIGKSSLLFQLACAFAVGHPQFGIKPARPWRVLFVQAENDKGDMAEMAKGIESGLNISDEDFLSDESKALMQSNLSVRSVCGKIGQPFFAWLHRQIVAHRADIVCIDPLLSFSGIDVASQVQASTMCSVWIDPMLKETGAVLISAHHTGKPPRKDGKREQPQSLYDLMYSGLGSSVLVNWARAVIVLQPRGGGAFSLSLAKRGKRAGATHPDTSPTEVVWLRHSDRRIFWEQIEPPEDQESKGGQAGRPSKVAQVIALGLGQVTDKLTTPTSMNAIADTIKKLAFNNGIHISRSSCLTIVAGLSKNKAIKETDGGYIKA